jgi:DNA anti-recombination protein RmuC
MTSTQEWSTGRVGRRPATPEERVRRRARNLADGSGARLRRAASRAAGDAGAALAAALIDMVRSEIEPADWPLAEMIRMLSGATADRDHQVRRLLEALKQIADDVDRLSELLPV